MQDQEFFDILDENGIAFTADDRSIRFKVCPECGDAKWKVYFYRDRKSERSWFNGGCARRGCKWNSFSYLEAWGVDLEEIRALHGKRVADTEEEAFDFARLLQPEPQNVKPPYVPKRVGTKRWFNVEDWPDHPSAEYAVSRGYVPELKDYLMIDTTANAIVFLIRDAEGHIVGWQKRFVHPTDPRFKTENPKAEDFKKSQHVMEIPGEGDICLVEGPATAFGAWHMGLHAVCTFGALISQKQLQLIKEIALRTVKRVAVGYDLDFAGVLGYYKIKNFMTRYGVEAYRVKPEEGNDLNDAWKAGKKYTVIEVEDADTTVMPLVGIFERLYE